MQGEKVFHNSIWDITLFFEDELLRIYKYKGQPEVEEMIETTLNEDSIYSASVQLHLPFYLLAKIRAKINGKRK